MEERKECKKCLHYVVFDENGNRLTTPCDKCFFKTGIAGTQVFYNQVRMYGYSI